MDQEMETAMTRDDSEVLSFRLGKEVYAISILGTVGERMLILLDIDKLMQSDELGLVAALPQAA